MCLADYEVARGIAGGHLRSMLRRKPSRRPALARLAAAAVVLVAVLSLAGCGGSDDGGQTTAPALTDSSASAEIDGSAAQTPSSDEPDGDPATDRTKIQNTITAVLSGSDPIETCQTLVTEHYVKTAYGDAAGCRKAQDPKAAADKLEIGQISISPEAVASTSVRAKGGIYAGEQLKVALVLQDGEWKLDSLEANVPVGP